MPLPADRLPADLRALPQEVATLKRELRELRAARNLQHSSIDGGALVLGDASGNVAGKLGTQADGTVGYAAVTGPTPPTPTDPTVTAQLAALSVTWDGTFVAAATLPSDWLRVEIHVSTDPAFTPSQATLRQTIETPSGGTALIALPYTAQYVRLRSVTTSGAASAPTNAITGTPRQADAGDITVNAINGKTFTGTNWIQNPAGTFFYAGTPAFGNLIASLAYTAGADGFGNAYGAGMITYDPSALNFAQIYQGLLLLGSYNKTTGLDTTDAAFISALTAGQLRLASSITGTFTDQATFNLQSGQPSKLSGSGFNPFVRLTDTAGTSAVDFGVSGALVKTDLGGAFATNHVVGATSQPAYAANFASGSTAGTYQNLQYRLDAEDGLRIDGAFHCTAGITSATVFTLPTGFRPAVARAVSVASDLSTGTVATTGLLLQVNSNGQVNLHASAATATSQNFYVNATIPMGNLA